MEEESCVPPGFRFHPTEEELVGYYLARKVSSQKIDLDVIQEVDLYRIEPWQLQERCKDIGHRKEQQTEWYFFSYKDRKYPSGTRTNRATTAGFWKATGRDKAVLSGCRLIGMRKTLVFYKGRAPNGLKTDWIIHEYRLQSSENEPTQEEGWVVCRAFRKASSNQRPNHSNFGHDNNYCENTNYMPCSFHCDVEDEYKKSIVLDQLLQIPQLESPCDLSSSLWCNSVGSNVENNIGCAEEIGNGGHGEVVDWKALDKLLSSSSSKAFLPLNYDAGGGNFHEEDYFIN